MYSAPATPQYAYAPPMPTFERGGRVKDTYGLENAAEMIRQRGREGDTVLAHISPEEAGILKLLGGSGTINPHTGLPEFKSIRQFLKSTPVLKDVYKVGSQIGKGIESGIESIAKALGPVGQIAAAYFGGPIGAALYAGLAPEGSSFDTKSALKAGALTYAAGQLQGMGGAEAGGGTGSAFTGGETGAFDISGMGTGIDAAAGAPGMYPSVSQAVSSVAGPGFDASSAGPFEGAYSDAATSPYPTTPAPAPTPTPTAIDPYAVDNVGNISEGRILEDSRSALRQGYDAARQGYDTAVDTVKSGIKSVIPEPIQNAYGAVKDFATDIIPPDYREMLSTAKDVALIGSGATTAYGVYQTKKELEAAKAEADRILADQANRKKEEVEWAQGVMRDYPYNYKRLTEEEVRSERGMAMGGRITSYDDEIGGDDSMMQGGIAALAKGGLPPRYLRGGGDGMSDSIRANIEGKQEARLADGEFVVPADVVSHLGNGSSNAGAKKLYAMMDRVRKSRTGKTRQAPEVNTRGMMPA